MPPAAGGGAGHDNPPPPAPGGNGEPEEPADEPAPVGVPFTRLPEIKGPRRALSASVRALQGTQHFTQLAQSPGAESALRDALKAFTRASLNAPADFHAAVEQIHGAVTDVRTAWTPVSVPSDAAEALAEAVRAADFFAAAWRATVTSPAWDTLFDGVPRPEAATPKTTTPAPASPAPAGAADGNEIAEWAVPGITLAEQHAAIRTVINDFGSLNNGVPEPGSGLAAFVVRMTNPARWRAWRDELVATQRGTWLGGSRRGEDTQNLGRVDASADGILISTKGTDDRPAMSMVMRWEELPAWIQLGLNDDVRRDLLNADALFTAAPQRHEVWARLNAIERDVWDTVQSAGGPTAEALAASWDRYLAPRPDTESTSLFDMTTVSDDAPYTSIDDFTRATENLITAAWTLRTHPHW